MTIYLSIKLTMTAEKMSEFLFEHIFLKFEFSKEIMTNRDSLFTSNYWFNICFYLKIKRNMNIAFHSQFDEQTKKQNQILEHYFRCFCNHKQDKWASLLSLTQFVYNCAKHASTKMSFFETLLEYNSNFLWHLDESDIDIFVARNRIVSLLKRKEKLENNLRRATKSQIKFANRELKRKKFKVNDQIMLFIKNIKQAKFKKKLLNKYTNSFKIEDIVAKQTYCLRLLFKWRIHSIFHVFLFENYYNNNITFVFSKIKLINDQEEWKIEKILDRKNKKKFKYLMRWKSFALCENQWISKDDLKNAFTLLENFKRKRANIVSSNTLEFKKKKTKWNKHKTKRFDLRTRKDNE